MLLCGIKVCCNCGGSGHKWAEFKAGISPDWVKPEEQSSIAAATKLKDDIGTLANAARKDAGAMRALGNERAAKLLEDSIIDPKDIGPRLDGQLASMEAAARRQQESSAQALKPTSEGGGINLNTQQLTLQEQRYKQLRAHGVPPDQARKAAGL